MYGVDYSPLGERLEKADARGVSMDLLQKISDVTSDLIARVEEGVPYVTNKFEWDVALELAKVADEAGDEELAKSMWDAVKSGFTRVARRMNPVRSEIMRTMYAARPFLRFARVDGRFVPKVRETLKEGADNSSRILRAQMARRAASYGLAGLGGATVGAGATWEAMRRRRESDT